MKKIVLLISIFIITACAPKSGIEVADAWTRSAGQSENGAIYFTIINHDEAADSLIGISADIAEAAEIHETRTVNDVAEMQMLDTVPLPSGERVEFAPGGLHIMLVSLSRGLAIGETIDVTLHFQNHADIPLTLTAQAGPDHNDHDD